MNNNLPVPIMSEHDLDVYDKYINSPETTHKSLPQYLSCHISKLVKVEVAILNRIESKVGVLMDVGNNYLVLKLPECQSVIIESSCIKFITVMHGGKNYR